MPCTQEGTPATAREAFGEPRCGGGGGNSAVGGDRKRKLCGKRGEPRKLCGEKICCYLLREKDMEKLTQREKNQKNLTATIIWYKNKKIIWKL